MSADTQITDAIPVEQGQLMANIVDFMMEEFIIAVIGKGPGPHPTLNLGVRVGPKNMLHLQDMVKKYMTYTGANNPTDPGNLKSAICAMRNELDALELEFQFDGLDNPKFSVLLNNVDRLNRIDWDGNYREAVSMLTTAKRLPEPLIRLSAVKESMRGSRVMLVPVK